MCVYSSVLQISLQELVTSGQRKRSSAALLVVLDTHSSTNGYLCYLINIRLIPLETLALGFQSHYLLALEGDGQHRYELTG